MMQLVYVFAIIGIILSIWLVGIFISEIANYNNLSDGSGTIVQMCLFGYRNQTAYEEAGLDCKDCGNGIWYADNNIPITGWTMWLEK